MCTNNAAIRRSIHDVPSFNRGFTAYAHVRAYSRSPICRKRRSANACACFRNRSNADAARGQMSFDEGAARLDRAGHLLTAEFAVGMEGDDRGRGVLSVRALEGRLDLLQFLTVHLELLSR